MVPKNETQCVVQSNLLIGQLINALVGKHSVVQFSALLANNLKSVFYIRYFAKIKEMRGNGAKCITTQIKKGLLFILYLIALKR